MPDEGRRVLGAPPVELLAALAPVPPVPLPHHRGHPPVGRRLVLAAERELPAHLRLELDVAASLGLGRLVQGAARAGREPGPVEEDAGAVDQPGAEIAVGQLLHHALLSLLVELPEVGGEFGGGPLDGPGVLLAGEVGPVGAAALHQLGRRPGEDALAPLAEDARPGAGQEGHVEEPGALLVGIVEADPFVGIGGHVLVGGRHALMMTGMSEDREDIRPVLTITPDARATVLEVLANEAESDSLALWLEISGETNGAYAYDMYFQALADAGAGDVVQHDDDLPVVVPEASVDRLQGATLDFVTDDSGEGGLVIVNPNTPPAPTLQGLGSGPEVDLSDPLAQQVVSVLDEQVNPSIAAHGGRADLVAVEDTSVYLRLSGGCQGCGMAKATLSQGIEVILREAIPEIVDIVDVTDHADGTNPYYEPAHS